jgi:hypothetical protein
LKRGITGIPAVVSDFEERGSISINGCNGRRFPPGDASALAETLDSLCAERRGPGDHGKKQHEDDERTPSWRKAK